MVDRKMSGRAIFMAAVFIASAFMLGIKVLNPTPIQIFVEGTETSVSQIPGFFTYTDAAILIASSLALGVSGHYMLSLDLTDRSAGVQVLEERKKRWMEMSRTLKVSEFKIYDAVLDSDGIISQSELTEITGLSKSDISRTLDLLESKGLVERRRRGMGNIVLLK